MALGINKAILIGNVGQTPDIKQTNDGRTVTTLSLATSDMWKDKQTGEKQERTEWHRIVFYNQLGEIAGKYVRKGSKLYIEGSIRTRKWQDQQGIERYTTEIVANEMQMLDNRQDEQRPPHPATAQVNHFPSSTTPSPNQTMHAQNTNPMPIMQDLGDDIPF